MTNAKFWFFNGRSKMILGALEFESFEAARQWAAKTNKDGAHADLGYIEIIANAPRPELGRVTTGAAPVQFSLL